jgi:hypothetical protein
MYLRGMLLDSFPQGVPATSDQTQLGYDLSRGLFLARVLRDAELALHAKPLHRGDFILGGQALTLFTTRDKFHNPSSIDLPCRVYLLMVVQRRNS